MRLSPDENIFWQHEFFKLNATIVTTWVLMLALVGGSWWVTRRLSTGMNISRWQHAFEIVVLFIQTQIQEVGLRPPDKYMGFLGTLFLFIGVSNFCTIFPGYEAPTGSLSTTTALAISVFIAVPIFGIAENGLGGYLINYLKPTLLMLPFNIVGELSRTLALAIRLFGNVMSGAMILAIVLGVAPFIFPIVTTVLGLLTGLVQAYIFTILATVYIAAAARAREEDQ